MSRAHLPIETERLRLRCFEPSDLNAVVAYHALPDVQRYLDWKARDRIECKHAVEAMASQVSLQRPGDMLTLAIVRNADKALMGQITLRWADATASQAEVRFLLSTPYRRQGYGTEAVKAMLDLGFDHYHFHRIFARCDARNRPSAQLLKKVGLRLEAHFREHALFQGEWDDELHFAILDREWRRATQVREFHRRVA
jgi:RimJ/RimL family protein N-acetyltransferase